MTREQRRSKSRLHNRRKRAGFRWARGRWWEAWRFGPFLARAGYALPVYHADHETAGR